ncbi:MAG: hypothetical protein GY940_24650 [bacterium]|nr:hypothetical protein [bacterium]
MYTSEWLVQQGYSRSLLNKYKKNRWISSIDRGAYILADDRVDWAGGLFALQNQLKLNIHVGGKTALQLRGLAHFLAAEIKKIYLFGDTGQKLPAWFKSYDWGVEPDYTMSNLFNGNTGFSMQDYGNFKIRISTPERAIMETLYFVPQKQTFEESSLLMGNMLTLRPNMVRELLLNSSSFKMKRLFLFLAERHHLPWFEQLEIDGVDIGKGKRVIVPGGVLEPKYRIIVPAASIGSFKAGNVSVQ